MNTSNINSTNKRIVKNTFFLYMRMILKMGISLFSSRVILQVLGVSDYGLYNAIGSIVAMFAMIKGTLDAGTSRFLTYELEKGDEEKLRQTFNASARLHLLISIIILLLCETIGLWFLNFKMNIPAERYFAAKILFQASIISCCFTIIQVPFSASIIAHEKMSLYAWIGLGEAFWNLGVLFLLLRTNFSDKLILYGVLVLIWNIMLMVFYFIYCLIKFNETRFSIVDDKTIYKKLLSFSVWDLIGTFCATGNSQGLNILINLFFGVAVNAARGVAYQVENAIQQFVNNFMTAVTPQITKRFADNNIDDMLKLVYVSSKFSFLLLYMLSLPVFLEVEYLLNLWLVEVPEMTITFLRLLLPLMLIRAFARPIVMAVHATGNIKFLNLTSGIFSVVITLPVTYFLFKIGLPAKVMFFVLFFTYPICNILELLALRKEISFSFKQYFITVILNGIVIALLSGVIPFLLSQIMPSSFIRLLLVSFSTLISIIIFTFVLGVNKDDREIIINEVKKKLFK